MEVECCDMHLHTDQSDGTLAPAQLVTELYSLKGRMRAENLALRGFSVCDHQTLTGVPLVLEALEKYEKDNAVGVESRLRYLVAVELAFPPYHIAAYFPRIGSESHFDVFKRVAAHLKPDKYDLVLIAESSPDTLSGLISTIHGAQGIASIAHPPGNIRGEMPAFLEAGIDAIEAFNKRNTETDVQAFLQLSYALGLLPTGGSDFHYADRDRMVFAPLPVPFFYFEQVEQLADARYGNSDKKPDEKRIPRKARPREELAAHVKREKNPSAPLRRCG